MKQDFSTLYYLTNTLTILSNLKNNKVFGNLCKIIEIFAKKNLKIEIYPETMKYYTEMCEELYLADKSASLSNYLYDLILYNENPFSSACAKGKFHEISSHIIEAVKKDIKTVRLLSEINCNDIITLIIQNNPEIEKIKDNLPSYSNSFKHYGKKDIWEDYISDYVRFYTKNGTGDFAKHYSFRVDLDGKLIPVKHPDNIKLSSLKLYEAQKQKANDNLISFLSNSSYNNVLLYGDRGTGKSSCVKALANEYAEIGLRVIQLEKNKLKHLSNIMQELSDNPLKFLIFIDDLTFTEDDDNMGTLKAVLEGSVCAQPQNTVIYATSNRRHIVKETFTAREGNEIHKEDTIDEIMSLSDRFGLMITFQMPTREHFLDITMQIAEERGIQAPCEEIAEGVERYALERGYRSPRIAKQYLDLTYNTREN
jgi:hypothetical protein